MGDGLLHLALGALAAHRLRSLLSMLGIAIGVAAVILLTSIGEGTRAFILAESTQFGTNILAVHPGHTKTIGIPGVLGGTTRKLTIDDAEALARLPGIETVVPTVIGTARVAAGERGRSVPVLGVTPEAPLLYRVALRQGSFWPGGDPRRGGPWTVLGPRLAHELFGTASPLGEWVRIAGRRFRVLGVMAPKGQMMGFDIDDLAWVPVATALRLFNLDELLEIDLVYAHAGEAKRVEAAVRVLLVERHGKEDFTLTTQEAMLAVLDNVMRMITLAIGAIAGISLLVGATGILTMMWIAVGERTAEIGLVRSFGATRGQVGRLFLLEAA
ncbi:MAG TPA: ABC transporter permease, partial [Thermoanaerobaculia bacterium]|nr:ABC transporter permease [Thermoanaerobaculia bacterium]